MDNDIFLSEKQVDFLTGIHRGKTIRGEKQSKHVLQADHLRSKGIPFTENARGKPIVARSAIEGGMYKQKPVTRGWQPQAG